MNNPTVMIQYNARRGRGSVPLRFGGLEVFSFQFSNVGSRRYPLDDTAQRGENRDVCVMVFALHDRHEPAESSRSVFAAMPRSEPIKASEVIYRPALVSISMTPRKTMSDVEPFTLDLTDVAPMGDRDLFAICVAKPDLRIERNAAGQLEIMSPSGSSSSACKADRDRGAVCMERTPQTRIVFTSSGGFISPTVRSEQQTRHGSDVGIGIHSRPTNATRLLRSFRSSWLKCARRATDFRRSGARCTSGSQTDVALRG